MDFFETQPTGERRPTWRLWVLVGVVVFLIVAVIGGVLFAIRMRQRAEDAQQFEELALQQATQSIVNCADMDNPESCEGHNVSNTAVETGSSGVCDLLDGAYRDNCIFGVAREEGDEKICASIAEERIRVTCTDSILRARAYAEHDANLCDKLSEEAEVCRSSVQEIVARDEGCDAAGIDASYCDARDQLKAAIVAEDPDMCDVITVESVHGECVDTLRDGDPDHDDLPTSQEERLGTDPRNVDSDGDGLTDGIEFRVHQTDPANPDTDGDTFSDGVEVNGGYNPLGPGLYE